MVISNIGLFLHEVYLAHLFYASFTHGPLHKRIRTPVFYPGFQKGRVQSEKGTFSAVSGPSKEHNLRCELKKKGIISVANGAQHNSTLCVDNKNGKTGLKAMSD